MAKPLETLQKILRLEEEYEFRDKAVGGGLARYADTWFKQANEAYGETGAGWVQNVADRLRAYSTLASETRRNAMQELWNLLQSPPTDPDPALSALNALSALPAPTRPISSRPPLTGAASRGLTASVESLSGVGRKRAELLQNLGIRTLLELIQCYPRRYEDYSQLKTIDHLTYGEMVSVIGTIWDAGGRETGKGGRGRYLFRAVLGDHTGTIELIWFNNPYLEGKLKAGMQVVVSGKIDEHLGRLRMNAPDWEALERRDLNNVRIQPIYPLTEGLTQKQLRQIVDQALSAWAVRVPEILPDALRQRQSLIALPRALWGIHFPDNEEHLKAARRRLAFDEALVLQLGLLQQKRTWKAQPGRTITVPLETVESLKAALPYALTNAQRRSLDAMLSDLASGQPMNRLLQGDVGSGKTVVAALLMAVTARAGLQAALMAPTEILAEQHYKSIARLFEAFPEPRPTVAVLTGSTPAAERETIYAGLTDGSIQTVIGTHALIQDKVVFHDLGLVVIDEQHRFGVEQRGQLRGKGYNPHLLVMTATPIPRSLELTIWGHLDVSVLDEMPPGRQPVQTRVLQPRERERAYAFIQSQIAQGRQAFIIYPLVEASEKIEAKAAVDEHARLQKEVFPTLQLGLLHGQMSSDEKDTVMGEFVRGEKQILVATSVVEVGIDVPNASIILIEGAERFGLSQLHQFRGRVGRGAHQSYCLLLSDNPTEEALQRLKALEATTDGFVLAQKDLEMRGPGEFMGTQQSGFPTLRMALLADVRLLHEVREVATQLLTADPDLVLPEHQGLSQRVTQLWQQTPTIREGDLS